MSAVRGRRTTSPTRLSQLRLARELTLDEVAVALGVADRHRAWAWMSGARNPTETTRRRLIELLATPEALERFFFDTDPERRAR